MLEDNQIWEDDLYVLKIEQWEENFHGIIFKKEQGTLRFLNIIINKNSRIEDLIKKMNLKRTSKFITLKEII